MSQDVGEIKGIEPYMERQGYSVGVTRFFGGPENGRCLQLTPQGGTFVCLDRKGVKRLRKLLKKALP